MKWERIRWLDSVSVITLNAYNTGHPGVFRNDLTGLRRNIVRSEAELDFDHLLPLLGFARHQISLFRHLSSFRA